MKILKGLCVLVSLLAMAQTSYGRDDLLRFNVQEFLNSPLAKEKLSGGIKFYFGTKNKVKFAEKVGTYSSNKKANAAGKSDRESCERAFVSAMISFQKRALSTGADAVINLKSTYKKNDLDSDKEILCGAGNIMSGVRFTGDVVKLKR